MKSGAQTINVNISNTCKQINYHVISGEVQRRYHIAAKELENRYMSEIGALLADLTDATCEISLLHASVQNRRLIKIDGIETA